MTRHEHPFHYYRAPSEIREVQFSHRVRGLDEYEVAEYLDLLADQVHATDLELDRLRDELGRLRRENESLRTEMERSAAHPRAQTSPDATPQTASLLLNAQRVADDLVEEAVRRTRDMLTVARAERNAILRNAQEAAAQMLMEARESAAGVTPSRHSSGPSSLQPNLPSSTASSAPSAGTHISAQRTWQLDGHAAV
ncbi:MAG: DivIVA domain-containing protein [Nocardioidaceae bacterium]